jgi:anaerobic C4-dicarboxylate transporter
VLAAVSWTRQATARIGKYLLNHSFMLPGPVSTVASTATALLLSTALV